MKRITVLSVVCCVLFYAQTLPMYGQEDNIKFPKRIVRGTPVNQHVLARSSVASFQQRKLAGAPKQTTTESHARSENQNQGMNKTMESSGVPQSAAESKSAIFSPLLLLLVIASVALVNGVSVWWYLRRKRKLSRRECEPRPVENRQISNDSQQSENSVEEKIHHVADSHLQSEEQEAHEEAESVLDMERPSSERELEKSLRQMKYKHQASVVLKVAQKKMSKVQMSKTAKKLGTGIGELELATRLMHFQKKGANHD